MSRAGGVIIDRARVVMVKIIQAIQPEWILPGGKQTSISLYQHGSVFWNIISELQFVSQKRFAPLFADLSDWQQEIRASSSGAVLHETTLK